MSRCLRTEKIPEESLEGGVKERVLILKCGKTGSQ